MFDQQSAPASGSENETDRPRNTTTGTVDHRIAGVDVVVEWHGDLETLAHKLRSATAIGAFRLALIANHDMPTPPGDGHHRANTPRWRCRFLFVENAVEGEREVPWLLSVIGEHMRWISVEKFKRGNAPLPGMCATREMAAL